MIEYITIEGLKSMCLQHIEKGGSAVIYIDRKEVSLDGENLSFNDAADKLRKELNLYHHERF